MSAQVNINSVDATGSVIVVSGFIVLSGSYVSGGDPLNFTSFGTLPVAADPTYVGLLPAVESTGCLNIDVWSMNGSSINGSNSTNYDTVVTKTGTPSQINPQTGIKLKVGALSATPSTEHSAASYESQYTGDVIAFMAVFQKML